MVAVFFAFGWMAARVGIIDVGLIHIFEVLAEPLEGLGVSLLIGDIALGLVSIGLILSKQAIVLPAKLTEIATGKESKVENIHDLFPKWNLIVTYLGMMINRNWVIAYCIHKVEF